MLLPFVGPGGRGFSLVLMIQFPKYSAFGLVLGNCIIRTKENPRPPGPPHGNVSFLQKNSYIANCLEDSRKKLFKLFGSESGASKIVMYIHNVLTYDMYLHNI